MLEGITIGQYVPGDSPVHTLDPRVKLVATVVLITVLFLINSFAGYGLIAAFLVGVFAVARLPVRYVWRGLRPLMFIVLLTVVLNMLMTPGQVWAKWGPFTVTDAGVIRGSQMGLRLILLVVATSLLTLATSPISLTDGIESLLRPFRRVGVPAHELAMMMTIALRFIPTLLEETDKIIKAQMARGADFESGNLLRRARNMIPLLVPLFLSAFRRADELATAMESRCYRGGEGRTRLRALVLTRRDVAVLSAVVVFSVAVAVIF